MDVYRIVTSILWGDAGWMIKIIKKKTFEEKRPGGCRSRSGYCERGRSGGFHRLYGVESAGYPGRDRTGRFFNGMISGLGSAFEIITFAVFICAPILGFWANTGCPAGQLQTGVFEFQLFCDDAARISGVGRPVLVFYRVGLLLPIARHRHSAPERGGHGIRPRIPIFPLGHCEPGHVYHHGGGHYHGVYIRKLPSFQTSAVCCAMMGNKIKPGTKPSWARWTTSW